MDVRDATDEDGGLLADMLLEAYNWTGSPRFGRADLAADPHARRYLDGWRRPGDVGVVAVEDATPLGAAWARPLPRAEAGYGYVADDVPELAMGVVAGHRGRGVGTALLDALVERARDAGHRALSLSVEDGNDVARALYVRHGFVVVGRTGDADTMLLDLTRPRDSHRLR